MKIGKTISNNKMNLRMSEESKKTAPARKARDSKIKIIIFPVKTGRLQPHLDREYKERRPKNKYKTRTKN